MDWSSACRSGRLAVDTPGPPDSHLAVPASIDCDVVLFDMDGTLVDSTPVVERIWGRWAAKHGVDLPRLLQISHGRPTIETLSIIAPHLATAEEAARLDAEESDEPDGLSPVRGAPELIASLPADRWGVVTSAGRRLAVSRLTAAGLPVPRVLVTSDDVDRGKPDPACRISKRPGSSPSPRIVPSSSRTPRSASPLAVPRGPR